MASRAQWITWFSTAKKPLGTQFADVLTLLFKKDEDSLPIASVTNLQTILNSKANAADLAALQNKIIVAAGETSKLIPAGTMIETFWAMDNVPFNLNVGSTVNGTEYIDGEPSNEDNEVIYDKKISCRDAKTLHFSGVTANTVIVILKR